MEEAFDVQDAEATDWSHGNRYGNSCENANSGVEVCSSLNTLAQVHYL